jgi:hypothetical protein
MIKEGLIKNEDFGFSFYTSQAHNFQEVSKELLALKSNIKLGEYNGNYPLHYACSA